MLLLSLLSSCNLLRDHVWEAPAKHDTLQAQLDLLGRVKSDDVSAAVKQIESEIRSAKEVTPTGLQSIVRRSLPPTMSPYMDTLWHDIQAASEPIASAEPDAKDRYCRAVRTALAEISDDSDLYWLSFNHHHTGGATQTCAECLAARGARNELIARFIVRIQDYHESNYTDVFEGAAGVGLGLDIITTVSAALAAAVTPAGTKTFWATIATIASGTRLAASKNVLNEKNSSTVLNAMMKARTEKLAALWKGMGEDTKTYDVSEAKIGLVEYFNAGGLYKALAEMDAATTEAKQKASNELERARAAVIGSFSASAKSVAQKQNATVTFNKADVLSHVNVTSVRVGDDLLHKDAYKGSVTDGVLHVRFTSPPPPGVRVSIYGECAEPGPHAGMIEWE
jgi:hypothetical protein